MYNSIQRIYQLNLNSCQSLNKATDVYLPIFLLYNPNSRSFFFLINVKVTLFMDQVLICPFLYIKKYCHYTFFFLISLTFNFMHTYIDKYISYGKSGGHIKCLSVWNIWLATYRETVSDTLSLMAEISSWRIAQWGSTCCPTWRLLNCKCGNSAIFN